MKYTKAMRQADYFRRMESLGFTYTEADKLRLIEKTLSRWSEHECNGNIQREGEQGDGKPRWHSNYDSKGYRIADREAGALRRLQQIMASHQDLWFYHQTDPRGCALYVGRKTELQRNLSPIAVAAANGCVITKGEDGLFSSPQVGSFKAAEKDAVATIFLHEKGIPDVEQLPVEQYYSSRGVACCLN